MEYFVQQLINGITLGSIYGLIAIGYTMVYGIIGMINFAHGDIFMVGAFLTLIAFLVLVAIGITAVPLALLLVLRVARVLLFVRHFDVLHTVLEAPVRPENNAQAVVQFLIATPRISAKVCKITRK